ncbi:MAG: endo-1,4-beta-xylanase [Gaiellaceae bacterium]
MALTPGARAERAPAGSSPSASRQTQDPTLRELATRRGLLIGTAVNSDALTRNPRYAAAIGREFSSVTPENAMKWMHVEPGRGVDVYTQADRLVAFAGRHHQIVRGHNLVWHSQLPGWLTGGHFGKAALDEILFRHINAEVSHFRGRVYSWDVVNEPLADDGTLRETIWEHALGPGYIAKALEWAHAADPKARLYLNDYGIEGSGAKADAMYALAKKLLAKHVPLDGIGFEGHLDLQYGFPPGMAANMRRFAALGLDIAVTEADVRMQLPATPDSLSRQADAYRKLVEACLAVKRCVSFTVWGFTDRYSWVPGWFPGEGAANLLDVELRPKPAYRAVWQALAGPRR